MKKDIKFILFPLLAIIIFGGALFFFNKNKEDEASMAAANQAPQLSTERDGAYFKGPANAKVTVVEFFDPECEGCAAFHPILQKIVSEYPDDVKLVARYMLYHGNSHEAALALEGAGKQGKFWEMYNFMLERQNEWSHRKEPVRDIFSKFASELKLDLTEFNKAYDDITFRATLAKDVSEGQQLGVRGTPTFFINGKILMNLSQQDLKAAIESALGR